VARITRTHGRRGEVTAELLTDFPERFQPGGEFWITGAGARQRCELESCAFHKGRVLLKFRGVDSILQAEEMRGGLVQVPRAQRHPLLSRCVYISDLMGCNVLQEERLLGSVTGWEETGAVPLLQVRSAEGEILIPFAEAICGTPDLERKEIRVRLPEGLAELNQPAPAKRPGQPRRRAKR
jgi:16S rRNA processing protein RimM